MADDVVRSSDLVRFGLAQYEEMDRVEASVAAEVATAAETVLENVSESIDEPGSSIRATLDGAYVTFRDTDGNPIPARRVIITVNTTTNQVDDIFAEEV